MLRNTVPELPSNPRNTMSPPSCATAGLTRVSRSSLIWTTISSSFGSYSSRNGACPVSPSMTGRFRVKCSMMAPSTIGLSACQSPWLLVTVTKSGPNMTPDTPSISKSRVARGDFWAEAAVGKSAAPAFRTSRPGRNFMVAGLGVDSVWMNTGRPSNLGTGWRCGGRHSSTSPPEQLASQKFRAETAVSGQFVDIAVA